MQDDTSTSLAEILDEWMNLRDELDISTNWGTNLSGPCKFKDEVGYFIFFWSSNLVTRFTHIMYGEVENPGFELQFLHKLSLVATN